MIYAVIGYAIVTLGVVAGLVVKLVTTMTHLGNQRVATESHAKELARAAEAMERLAANLKSEQERADALDDELAKSYDHPDPVGARERVLSKWQLDHHVARGRTVTVPAPATAKEPGPDDLINPFDE